MKTRRSFLSALSALPLLGLGSSGCAGQTAAMVLSEVEAGITDAEIAIQTVMAGVDAYFAAHPNPKLQGEIDSAVTDATTALRAVTAALAGATSITAGNVQAALQAFSTAYSTLMQLVAQIGIQTAPAGTAAARVGGNLYVPKPRLLQLVKAPAAPAPAAPAPAPAPAAAPAPAPAAKPATK